MGSSELDIWPNLRNKYHIDKYEALLSRLHVLNYRFNNL